MFQLEMGLTLGFFETLDPLDWLKTFFKNEKTPVGKVNIGSLAFAALIAIPPYISDAIVSVMREAKDKPQLPGLTFWEKLVFIVLFIVAAIASSYISGKFSGDQ